MVAATGTTTAIMQSWMPIQVMAFSNGVDAVVMPARAYRSACRAPRSAGSAGGIAAPKERPDTNGPEQALDPKDTDMAQPNLIVLAFVAATALGLFWSSRNRETR